MGRRMMAPTFCLLHSEWTNQICYCRFSQVATAPGVTLASPCHCQLQFAVMFSFLPKPVRNAVKTWCPLRNAFTDIFMSFNVKMPSSADRTTTPAATTVVFLVLARLTVNFLNLSFIFFCGFDGQVAAVAIWLHYN